MSVKKGVENAKSILFLMVAAMVILPMAANMIMPVLQVVAAVVAIGGVAFVIFKGAKAVRGKKLFR